MIPKPVNRSPCAVASFVPKYRSPMLVMIIGTIAALPIPCGTRRASTRSKLVVNGIAIPVAPIITKLANNRDFLPYRSNKSPMIRMPTIAGAVNADTINPMSGSETSRGPTSELRTGERRDNPRGTN